MLPADATLIGSDGQIAVRDVRETMFVHGAMGWGEVGPVEVDDVFVQFDHKGPLLRLRTVRGFELRCTPDHVCFGRLNPLLRQYSLYLHERSTLGFRVGMTKDLMRELVGMQNLKRDLFSTGYEIIERVWLIETTENLAQATFLEKFASFKYGLPTIPFSAQHVESELSEAMIHELFNRIDTPSRAQQLLLEWHMFEDQPHITLRLSGATPGTSNAIQFVVFGATERTAGQNSFAHLIRIDSTKELNRHEHKQFKRRMSNQGTWHLEVTRDDLEEAQLFVKTLSHLDNLEIVKKIQLSKKAPFYLLPASHVKPGMAVPVLGARGIEEDTVCDVKLEDYHGPLYDVRADGLQNYLVGNWVAMAYGGLKLHDLAENVSADR